MKAIKSVLTVVIAIIMISTFMVSIANSAEMNAFLGENLELKAENFLDFEPTSVYWLAYTGPAGFTNVDDQSSFTTNLQIVDTIQEGSLLDYYNVMLKGFQGETLLKTVIIQIYLEEKPWEIPAEKPMIMSMAIEETEEINTIDESEIKKKGAGLRQFRYIRKVKQNTTRVVVRMRADEVLPDINGPVTVTVTIQTEDGQVITLSDDFDPDRKQAGKKKVNKTSFQTTKEKYQDWTSAYTEF